MTDKPTDEALENLFVEETGFDPDDFPAAIFDFARAVLAKWGSPAHSGEPVATVIKRGASRDWMSERLGGVPDGVYSLYLAPQPVERAPLTGIKPGDFFGGRPEYAMEIDPDDFYGITSAIHHAIEMLNEH